MSTGKKNVDARMRTGVHGASAHAPAFLIDANVWIDFFIDRGRRHDDAVNLIVAASTHDVALFTPIVATKDVFFIVASELKRMQLEDAGDVSESFTNAASEAAWSCLSAVRKRSTVVAADASDMVESMVQRANHGDYEDNLVIAAAKRACVTHIVTSDEKLRKHSPVPSIGVEEALRLIEHDERPAAGSASDSFSGTSS